MTSKFKKSALIKSHGFKPIERDILSLKLVDSQTYTKVEVQKIIKEFKGGI
ncbi:hypothetical protein RIN67_03100 [Levilactobacillus namurensis]|uniref:hypothetical protein n=1 Tax=Levilactobacillus namurensis TaxID=380393 RepID=UPI0004B69A5A|nr:hypothetical protein [Levilactobacillus namurensis]MDT7019303.1 hypothetical protein [Levilactobacillus namurensis]WNN66096.1 hypothetical protein RIN67_03100 [Levilactobacillus namurensis]